MTPERNSLRLYGIARSKGKMFELALPPAFHIAIPDGSKPEDLLLLTVGTIGDVAAEALSSLSIHDNSRLPDNPDLNFAARFFDALIESQLVSELNRDVRLLASSAYYLSMRPGSSLLLARMIEPNSSDEFLDRVLVWLLQGKWGELPSSNDDILADLLTELAALIASHYLDGSGVDEILSRSKNLRAYAYRNASPRELLLVDLVCAISHLSLKASSWLTLPRMSGVDIPQWSSVIRRDGFPKELWPSQQLLGEASLFSGASGVVQMPTSAGKTRSIEIVIRCSFMSGRAKLAVIVAPFRALCHEISNSLRAAFRGEQIKVNELSDALQADYLEQIAELLGMPGENSKYVLVLTPEKFLYLLRQTQTLVDSIGMVVYDEGHQFDTGGRGIVYELLLTEIKRLLPTNAQTILISAVIQNAEQIGQWLIGDDVKVVSGRNLSPTTKSVAFASWVEQLGQLMFYEGDDYQSWDYFVPRVIETQKISRRPGESKERVFPEKGVPTDVSLYLGIRLARNGAVAIFCGRKDAAANIATRAAEIYSRDYSLSPPSTHSDADELRRLHNLYSFHFGLNADSTRATLLGVFTHHGNTPHGLRLAIEYAMQKGMIRFVACTSTLAQGVNLPIRYLIISGVYQGTERIKVRDFQNLVGRAGRAGMHTEGLVIFADPEIQDKKNDRRDGWRFNLAAELLDPGMAEPTASSLLRILDPVRVEIRRKNMRPQIVDLPVPVEELCRLLLGGRDVWQPWIAQLVATNSDVDGGQLSRVFGFRRHLITAIESYLMASRGSAPYDDYRQQVEALACDTLAYALADDTKKNELTVMFRAVSEFINAKEQDPIKQLTYSKTLLGVDTAKSIELWVNDNNETLRALETNEELLEIIWPLFNEHVTDKFFGEISPQSLPIELARLWLKGSPAVDIFSHAVAESATKPWGARRVKLSESDIMDFIENTLGFECALIVGAVAHYLYPSAGSTPMQENAFMQFQKSLQYGVPNALSISCYETGFADRMLAQDLAQVVSDEGYTGAVFRPALRAHSDKIAMVLQNYPTYFETVLQSLI